MRGIAISIILVFFSSGFLTSVSWGDEFLVSNATELHNALAIAETNGKDDIIKIQQGTYHGNFSYDAREAKNITLLGGYTIGFSSRIINPSNTVLDGDSLGRVLYIRNWGGDIFLEGFTIKNGIAMGESGGGVYAVAESTALTLNNISLINNIISDNSANSGAGVFSLTYAELNYNAGNITIVNNVITGNNAADCGGGVYAQSYSAWFGYQGGNITFTNNTIINNSCPVTAGGIYLYADEAFVNIYNNIIWGNSSISGGDIYISTAAVSNGYNNDYSDLYGSWTNFGNNINSYPNFVGSSNYHIKPNSLCIDAGTNSAPYISLRDFEGDVRKMDGNCDGMVVVDIGADEFDPYLGILFPVYDGHDFNGNGTSDMSVFRPSNGKWYIKGVGSYFWGQAGDIPVNGDYNGDGTTDIAVWRPSSGRWYLKGMGGSNWGVAGDIPVPGNYDGDVAGITDIAVWRPSNGRWYIKGVGSSSWGFFGDVPVPGDYDGDGKTDIAVWRFTNGKWYIKGLGSHFWGMLGDIPLVR